MWPGSVSIQSFFWITPSVTIEQLSASEYQYSVVIAAASPRIYFWQTIAELERRCGGIHYSLGAK